MNSLHGEESKNDRNPPAIANFVDLTNQKKWL